MMNRRHVIFGAGSVAAAVTQIGPTAAGQPATTYDAVAREVWTPIDTNGGLRELVRAATLAANSHNTQPWKFTVSNKSILIEPDFSRRCPAVDPDDHHLFASLGCATENMVQAATAMGLRTIVAFDPAGAGSISIAFEPAPAAASHLVSAITDRQCTRAEYDGIPVEANALRQLQSSHEDDGVERIFITDKSRMAAVLDYFVQGNTVQMRDQAFMAELKSWIRFSDSQAMELRDGLSSRSSGNRSLPAWFSRRLLPFVFTEGRENAKYAKHIRSSSGSVVFCAPTNDKAGWVLAGRAYQRFALEATSLGLKHAFVNQPVEVSNLRAQFATFLGLRERRPDLVVRFGRGPSLPKSLRRPVESVIARSS